MPMQNTAQRWGSVQQTLHWTIVVLVIAQLAMGFVAGLGHGPTVDYVQNVWHASVGILIFGLMLARLVWREANPRPELPADMNRLLAWLAHFTHFMFYALLILDPILGYLTGCAHGDAMMFFGLPLPSLVAKSRPLAHVLTPLHWDFGYAIIACIVVHVVGALQHEFINRDNVLRRMVPGLALRPERPRDRD